MQREATIAWGAEAPSYDEAKVLDDKICRAGVAYTEARRFPSAKEGDPRGLVYIDESIRSTKGGGGLSLPEPDQRWVQALAVAGLTGTWHVWIE